MIKYILDFAYMNLSWDVDIFLFHFLNINVVYDIAYINLIFIASELTSYSSEFLVFTARGRRSQVTVRHPGLAL